VVGPTLLFLCFCVLYIFFSFSVFCLPACLCSYMDPCGLIQTNMYAILSPRKLDGFRQNLAEGWGMGKEWSCKIFGDIALEASEKGAKYLPFFVINRPIHAPVFVTFALPISAKRGINAWISVRMNPFVALSWFFRVRGHFSPKTDFSVASMNFGVNNLKMVWRLKILTKQKYILGMSSVK